jgi:hypothetical protein
VRDSGRRRVQGPPRHGHGFVRRHRRRGPQAPPPRRRPRRTSGLRRGTRRPGLSDSVGRGRGLRVKHARSSRGPLRCASSRPDRRTPRFHDRRSVGGRRDHDRSRRRRRRRRRPRRRIRRRRLDRWRRLDERRQEEERVDVPLRVGGPTHAEVYVRDSVLGHPARADRANADALGDGRTALDGHGAEMEQRDGVAVRRLDRDRPPAGRHGPGERDDATRRRDDRGTGSRADVDAAVESARVWIGTEAERLQNRPLHRPGPSLRRCGRNERCRRRTARESRDQ